MTLNDIFIQVAQFFGTCMSVIEVYCKMLFQDLVILGLPLGWWFVVFAFIGFIISRIFGGNS